MSRDSRQIARVLDALETGGYSLLAGRTTMTEQWTCRGCQRSWNADGPPSCNCPSGADAMAAWSAQEVSEPNLYDQSCSCDCRKVEQA